MNYEVYLAFYYLTLQNTLVLIKTIYGLKNLKPHNSKKRIHKNFIIIAPKGMIKGSIWGNVKTYLWKDVDVKGYSIETFQHNL